MRPRTLDEFVGQEHLVGERGPLRKSIARGHLSSILLWGPPGTGKTSLARLLADAVGARFETMSAVMSGVADVRAVIAGAQDRLSMDGSRTILFLDEIHRFNKAQQDALLPHVEDGTITLIGATTENPYFEVNSALLSRMRVWRLEPLTNEQVGAVVRRAAADAERGLAGELGPTGGVALADDAFEHLVELAGGDARTALNVLEGATALAEGEEIRDAEGHVSPRLEDVETAAQQRVLAYDRAGDGHYDTVSAFIKSLRGNDPDGALYWLAAMIAAGEDPRFIARRLIISASEDVGNADPRALSVAVAAAQALDWVGLPGGAVRAGPGDHVHRHGAEEQSLGARLLGGRGGRRGQGLAPRPEPPAQRDPRREEEPRDRRRVSLSPRLRRRRRRPALPARGARRAALLPPHGPGLRGDDRGPDGRPPRGSRRGSGQRRGQAVEAARTGCRPDARRRQRHEDATGGAGRYRPDREGGR